MDLSKTSQEQKAGDNSSQYQQIGDNSNQTIIENQTNYITVADLSDSDKVAFTTQVSTQVTTLALKLCTQVSQDICEKRMKEFESHWIPIIMEMKNAVDNLKDPKFQFMIRDANISAAKSSRQEDLEMLTQLLVCHIEKGSDMKKDAGISKAIQIANEVDYDALCGLTCVAALLNTCPNDPNVDSGLQAMDDLYSKLLFTKLPEGDEWIDHLDVLGAIRIKSDRRFSIKNVFSTYYDGYVCVGIKDGSDTLQNAKEILKKNNYDVDYLVNNELLPGYLRIGCAQKGLLTELKPIFDCYSKDSNLLESVMTSFIRKWESYENLKKLSVWLNKIPFSFRITSVGYALAQTNAKRCYPQFPDLM